MCVAGVEWGGGGGGECGRRVPRDGLRGRGRGCPPAPAGREPRHHRGEAQGTRGTDVVSSSHTMI